MECDFKCFVIGQGLWSFWYVGNFMKDLDKKFGKECVIDMLVFEFVIMGVVVGVVLNGYYFIVVYLCMDFMILVVDQIVNQVVKWCYMLGGKVLLIVMICGIINCGGE